MMSALDSLPHTEWETFGRAVNVPESKLDKMHSQFTSDGERKEEVFRIYLTEHPCPTWEQVSEALYLLGDDNQQCHTVLDRLQSMFPTGECVSLSLLTFSLAPLSTTFNFLTLLHAHVHVHTLYMCVVRSITCLSMYHLTELLWLVWHQSESHVFVSCPDVFPCAWKNVYRILAIEIRKRNREITNR